MRSDLAWLVVLAFAGCKDDRPAALRTAEPAAGSAATPVAGGPVAGVPARRGTLRRPELAIVAVIAPPGADTSKLEQLARTTGAREGLADGALTLTVETPASVGWHREDAPYYGKSVPASDVDAIDRSTWALLIAAKLPGKDTRIGAHAGAVAIAVANACHGWIMDLEAHQLYLPAALAEHLPTAAHVDVRKTIVIHQVVGGGDLGFIDTAGLQRLGFPELYVADVPQARIASVTTILNATAQTLIDRGDLTRDGELTVDLSKLEGEWNLADLKRAGGTGTITWQVRWSRGDAAADEKLDPDLLVLELSLPGAKRGTAEALTAAVETYLGALEDDVRSFDYDDELAAAGVKARAALTALRPHFAKGIPPGEQLGVKAPFTTDTGGIEWMWVDVVAFKGAMIDGTLDNAPEQVKNLKLGQRVTVRFADVADFIHRHADGKRVGGYSLEVMRAHGEDVPTL